MVVNQDAKDIKINQMIRQGSNTPTKINSKHKMRKARTGETKPCKDPSNSSNGANKIFPARQTESKRLSLRGMNLAIPDSFWRDRCVLEEKPDPLL